MSISRLRKLAGLKESITDNPQVNAEIEHRLANPPPEMGYTPPQHWWLDLLEIIQDHGKNGVSPAFIAEKMREMNLNDTETLKILTHAVRTMLKYLPTMFDNVIRLDDKGWFHWRDPEQEFEDSIDPETRAAVGSQVDLTYTAMQLMRDMTSERGSFSESELAQRLSRQSQLSPQQSSHYANHVIGQFRSMLLSTAPGRYAMMQETPHTHDDSMNLFRDLETGARKTPDESV
jgi:hypothetical protein